MFIMHSVIYAACKVTLVPPRRSYRYFRIESNGVQCFNPSPVDGLTECRGNCESTGRYTPGEYIQWKDSNISFTHPHQWNNVRNTY